MFFFALYKRILTEHKQKYRCNLKINTNIVTTKLYHGGFHRLRNYSKKIAFFTASLSKKNRYKRLSLIAHRERRAHFGQWNRGGPAGQECLCARFMIRRCERYGGCRFLELLTFLQLLVHCCCLLLQHGKAEHYDYNTK